MIRPTYLPTIHWNLCQRQNYKDILRIWAPSILYIIFDMHEFDGLGRLWHWFSNIRMAWQRSKSWRLNEFCTYFPRLEGDLNYVIPLLDLNILLYICVYSNKKYTLVIMHLTWSLCYHTLMIFASTLIILYILSFEQSSLVWNLIVVICNCFIDVSLIRWHHSFKCISIMS